jgi:hypothetical protein
MGLKMNGIDFKYIYSAQVGDLWLALVITVANSGLHKRPGIYLLAKRLLLSQETYNPCR